MLQFFLLDSFWPYPLLLSEICLAAYNPKLQDKIIEKMSEFKTNPLLPWLTIFGLRAICYAGESIGNVGRCFTVTVIVGWAWEQG